jgi:hypothetical protein
MTYLRRLVASACGLAVLSCVLACGGVKQAIEDANNGMKLGAAFTAYASAHNDKGPPNADEWAKWAKDNGHAETVDLINECKPGGKYTFFWNVDLAKLPAPRESTIVGYENKVTAGPTAVVIKANGQPETMTPDQFKAAKKADGK